MGRGNATFGLMNELKVDTKHTPTPQKDVDLGLEESMDVCKAFNNTNFKVTMAARNKTRQFTSKPEYPIQQNQARGAMQGNPGQQAVATPPDLPTGGVKNKGVVSDASGYLGKYVVVPGAVGLGSAHVANLAQDKRAIQREQDQKRAEMMMRMQKSTRKGLLMDALNKK